ncbi:hypothetical protein PHYBLDRAFT_170169 [Phycomyces blakesleeanus NRRL 1555(-)]|uniref:Uncharacterized protein n=1 Tax=Phycomyces blakesleeanus (strain ATCC 8743b / DSM 1359 / FGSC 10004 / NBRC 33097 / NRRL 1555) TaxID=763407 RepID=A0A167M163_PHYB8|nr:hypothetical protein PHYBLDRAFT_170168 [Phycomyces blakesleeanus NRRL 1555(-)]XP_018289540.1 hypothetical protein PHYBLDRAFT_170169 [Phycomyces blakesleeanus NRRL 1555(-)]OAD71499.1 hypothetical protein PHYBLDRAFT_170168 [Phycomyces blakesleeanus NRRL 1555(-)]OAD71500.1 hypothetical protein PHYBLDRAFT_170169 [Phycomyces blakesleeanus NRRL 1555(-)]|eukprot:XP_018289539.1 hypothetical protein PHYBLDRAFT_170168 [Phycomyces blakesleeanus NRRL 1555(-)]
MKRGSTSTNLPRPLKRYKAERCIVSDAETSTVEDSHPNVTNQEEGPHSSSTPIYPKKIKAGEHGPEERVEQFTIKTSLHNTYRNNTMAQEFLKAAKYTTKVLFVGSMFANFVFIKLLNSNQEIPAIGQSLFINMFTIISGNGKNTSPSFQKTVQIDPQAPFRVLSQCDKPNYRKGLKTESDLIDFFQKLYSVLEKVLRTKRKNSSKYKIIIMLLGRNEIHIKTDVLNVYQYK